MAATSSPWIKKNPTEVDNEFMVESKMISEIKRFITEFKKDSQDESYYKQELLNVLQNCRRSTTLRIDFQHLYDWESNNGKQLSNIFKLEFARYIVINFVDFLKK